MPQVEKTKKNLLKCKCKSCPSYTFTCKLLGMPGNMILLMGSMDKKVEAETLFCAYAKSQCITEAKGCNCPGCDVYEEYNLDNTYYCLEAGGR